MSEAIENARLKIIEFRMAIAWFILFSVNSLCTCIIASMAGSVWANLGTQEKFTVIVAILANWTNAIMAFISKQAASIQQTGRILPIDFDSSVTREHRETDSIKISPSPSDAAGTSKASDGGASAPSPLVKQ